MLASRWRTAYTAIHRLLDASHDFDSAGDTRHFDGHQRSVWGWMIGESCVDRSGSGMIVCGGCAANTGLADDAARRVSRDTRCGRCGENIGAHHPGHLQACDDPSLAAWAEHWASDGEQCGTTEFGGSHFALVPGNGPLPWIIVEHEAQGFVSIIPCDTEAEAQAAFASIRKDVEAVEEEDDTCV